MDLLKIPQDLATLEVELDPEDRKSPEKLTIPEGFSEIKRRDAWLGKLWPAHYRAGLTITY